MRVTVRRIGWALLISVLTTHTMATPLLSSKAKISLLTVYPGEELFSAFGHSVFWIYDPDNHLDIVYSYGTYDFEQPNFYLNFVRGHLNYLLSTYSMEEQYSIAQFEQRQLIQQELALDSSLTQELYQFLEWNSLPENRYYLYDFYLDNCSSRLRDVLLNVAGKELQFDKSIQTPYSFRHWMNLFLGNHPVSALGMNIGLGAPSDRQTDYFTQMYLPINLKLAFASASLNNKPLVRSETLLFDAPDRELKSSNGLLFTFSSVLGLALLITFYGANHKLLVLTLDVVLFSFTFLLGLILALLWLATDHWVCAWNTDLLWANPLCLAYFFVLTKQKGHLWVKYVCWVLVALSLTYMSVGYLLAEKPILILFPLILAILIRVVHRLTAEKITQPSL